MRPVAIRHDLPGSINGRQKESLAKRLRTVAVKLHCAADTDEKRWLAAGHRVCTMI